MVTPGAIAADLARAVIGPDDPAIPARSIITRSIIIRRRVAIVARTEVAAVMPVGSSRREMMPADMVPSDSWRCVTVSTTTENMAGAKPAATEHRTAASEAATMKGRAATTEATAMEARAAAAEATAMKGCTATTKTTAMKARTAAAETAAMKARATATEAAASATAKTAAATMAADFGLGFGGQSVRGEFRCRYSARIDQRKRLCALVWCGHQRQHRGSRKSPATDKAAPGIRNLHHV